MSSRLLVGRYELVEKIGDGGMATVYKAKDRLLNRYVAIKVLRPEFTKDVQFVENFRKESQSAAGLSHPNVVSVYDVGREGSIHFIVMELIEGKTLTELIKEQAPMDYKTTVEIIKQVAMALSIAHRNGIIHRDVKPHNILITNDGVAKLADFGIAKAMSDSTLTNSNSKILGSVHYFSPEQARGTYVDERSDIYSLGIVMYEMLTGRVPFDGDSAVSVALMHINDEMVPPSRLVSGIPPAFERVVLKCTDKIQTNRYKNVDDLIQDLDSIEFLSQRVGDSIYMGRNSTHRTETVDHEEPVEEKRDVKSKDKKKKKLSKKQILVIAGVVVCLIPILYFVLTGIGLFNNSKIVKVPDLSGMTVSQASDLLDKYDLELEEGEAIYSPDYEEGEITNQTPKSGTEVKKGKTIIVNVSKGKQKGTVPSLFGQEYDNVEDYLKGYNFQLGKVTYEESDKPEGTIIDQSPAAGEKADEGDYISVVVSKGKTSSEKTVPSLTGISLDEAKAAILEAGFKVGKITYEESDAYGKNYVMWQEYGANTSLEEGTAIKLKVSKGTGEEEGGQ